nr:MAG TPA: hypothetical protein [Caudoviricetes sp.]
MFYTILVSVGSVSRNIFFELNFSEASVREDRRFIYLINHFNNI